MRKKLQVIQIAFGWKITLKEDLFPKVAYSVVAIVVGENV